MAKGQVLAEIDPRALPGAARRRRRARSKRTRPGCATPRPTSSATRSCRRSSSITAQQVVSQEALVRQLNGAIQSTEAQVANARLNLTYTQDHRADRRPPRPAPGRRRQHGAQRRRQRPRRHHADAADLGDLHRARDRAAGGARGAARRPAPRRSRPGTAPTRVKLATGALQTVDNQIDTATGTIKLRATLRERRRVAVPQPVRQHPPARPDARRTRRSSRRRRCSARPFGSSSTCVKPDNT